ncbi:MAG TPA: hypothetical protein VF203_15075 [Burkholderiales bacterium]
MYVTSAAESGLVRRPVGAVRLHPVDATHLAELATQTAVHLRYDRRSEAWRQINCPRRVAEAILARGDWRELPLLLGIAEAPTMTLDGRIIDKPGYDRRSGLFLAAVPERYKSPSPTPTIQEAQAAVDRLSEAVSTFPFVDRSDLAAFVAAVCTALVRRLLPAAPLIAITAPTPGTGKSLLADLIAMIALGRQAAMLALSDDETENEKRLYSALLAGDSLIIADNIEAPLRGVLLCQLLTQPSVQFRPLGFSSLVTAPTNTTLVATGNNLSIIGDLRRRVMLVRLDAKTERPETRAFARDALEYVRQRRGELVRDALTIMRGYAADGRPHVGVRPFGGFSEWDLMVRRAVVWAGLPDPLGPAEELRERDPDLEVTRMLFAAWRAEFGDHGVTVAEAIATARKSHQRFDGGTEPDHPELREALQAAAGDKLDSRRLAAWLRRHRDRVIDGLVLSQGEDRHAKVARWSVLDAACGVMRG